MKHRTIKKTAAGLAICMVLLLGTIGEGSALTQSATTIIVPTSNWTASGTTAASFSHTEVQAGAKESYMLTIPPELDLGELAVEGDSKPMASASFKLAATGVLIAEGASLEVTAAGSGAQDAFTLSLTGHGGDATVPFRLMNQDKEIKPGGALCTFEAGKPEIEQSFRGEVVQVSPAPSKYAGNYEGALIFTCKIVGP